MKKFIALFLMLLALLCMMACKSVRIVHCDICGREIRVPPDSNIVDEWTLYCDDCDDFLDEPQ